ncbi:MAG: transposase [Polyangiaceae bacterium]|nr:transposase [Polyangiaceae bacterium]
MDIFSRYIVGWMLADRENATLATQFIDETIAKYDVPPGQLTLHADRGAPMRSKLLLELPAKLDTAKSYSRPHTSNDNPFSESAFKTLKYHPTFPRNFHGDVDGRAACSPYFDWYNEHHHHSGIALLTPADVHFVPATGHGERQPPSGGPLPGTINIPFSSTTTFTTTGGLAH